MRGSGHSGSPASTSARGAWWARGSESKLSTSGAGIGRSWCPVPDPVAPSPLWRVMTRHVERHRHQRRRRELAHRIESPSRPFRSTSSSARAGCSERVLLARPFRRIPGIAAPPPTGRQSSSCPLAAGAVSPEAVTLFAPVVDRVADPPVDRDDVDCVSSNQLVSSPAGWWELLELAGSRWSEDADRGTHCIRVWVPS